MYKVLIDLNMFCPSMKNNIFCQFDSPDVIIVRQNIVTSRHGCIIKVVGQISRNNEEEQEDLE